jgi:hypothetical protein
MIRRLYLIYGLAVLGGLGLAQFRGWTLSPVSQLMVSPKSVRDNPGSYRSVYGYYHHYTGGK